MAILSSTASGHSTAQTSDDVGLMSQESHVSISAIIHDNEREMGIPLFPWIDEADNEGGLGDSSSEDEEIVPASDHDVAEVNEGLEMFAVPDSASSPREGMRPSELMQQIKEEIKILDDLVHSRNFLSSYVDMQGFLDTLKQANSTVRAKMAAALNHNKGQDWVSANVALATSNKRQKGSQFGFTKFH